MERFIKVDAVREDFSLRSFAKHLAAGRNKDIRADKRKPYGNWAHIAGFESNKDGSVPEVWAVSNIRSQTLEGPVEIIPDGFGHWEDLSTRDCRISNGSPYDLYAGFRAGAGGFVQYMNGHGDGRLISNVLIWLREVEHQLGHACLRISLAGANPSVAAQLLRSNGQFQALSKKISEIAKYSIPNSFAESKELMKRSVELIAHAFDLRKDVAVGGAAQVSSIPSPSDYCTSVEVCPLYPSDVIDNDREPVFARQK